MKGRLDRLSDAIKNGKRYGDIMEELTPNEYAAFFLGVEATRVRLRAPLVELREMAAAAIEAVSQEYD